MALDPDKARELLVARATAKAHAAASEWLERKVRQLKLDVRAGQEALDLREEQFSQHTVRTQADIDDLQGEIVRLEAASLALRDEAAARQTRIATLEHEGVQARAEVSRARAETLELRRQIDVYATSHSWRWTGPLRALRRNAGLAFRLVRSWFRRTPPHHEVVDPVPPQPITDPGVATMVATHPSTGVRPPFTEVRRPVATDITLAEGGDMAPRQDCDQDQQEVVTAVSHDGRTEAPAYDTLPSEVSVATPEDPACPEYVPLQRSTPVETRIKLIAFYLPQFHPIPENDAWWGTGFTEWTNVTRARPRFAGHYQPHLPGELGFYDLRRPEVQHRQIELARLFGIHGFCYHHYWFGGKTLLREPLEQLLAHPDLDFPFCLCWANENWTRRWDGGDNEILIAQRHSPQDDLDFLRDIEPALRDPRYIRVGDRPVLVVYRPLLLPDAGATSERWRAYCREVGLGDPFLIASQAFDRDDPREFGFDAALEFPPNNVGASPTGERLRDLDPDFAGAVYDYRNLVEASQSRPLPGGYTLFRGVMPMWDNEARRPSEGTIFVHSTPRLYQRWLEGACRWTDRHLDADRPYVFVNAWNEWAEGDHLEPDRRYGYAYLEATATALEAFPRVDRGRAAIERAGSVAEVL